MNWRDPVVAGALILTVLWLAGFGIFYLSYRLTAYVIRVWHQHGRNQ